MALKWVFRWKFLVLVALLPWFWEGVLDVVAFHVIRSIWLGLDIPSNSTLDNFGYSSIVAMVLRWGMRSTLLECTQSAPSATLNLNSSSLSFSLFQSWSSCLSLLSTTLSCQGGQCGNPNPALYLWSGVPHPHLVEAGSGVRKRPPPKLGGRGWGREGADPCPSWEG